MKNIIALAASAVLLVACTQAVADNEPWTPIHTCETTTATATRVAAQLPISIPDGWTIEHNCEPRTDTHTRKAQTDYERQVITLWVMRLIGDVPIRHVLLHEIGHAYDWPVLTDQQRDQWRQIRGLPPADELDWWTWDPDAPAEEHRGRPAEDWADAFAACHMPPRGSEVPIPQQCQVIAAWTGIPSPGALAAKMAPQ